MVGYAWAECQLLHHDLARRFGEKNVFIDTERIEDGDEIGPAVRGRAPSDPMSS